jgi:demethylmenaquinone methyltransferase/2-methoxy-6-polyprenyl-1,4-benzoquinol methylase
MTVVPYKQQAGSKKEQVALMFNKISKRYDFLNHFLSLGIDISWRKKAIKLLAPNSPKRILDIATGTADFAIEASKLDPDKIVGVDISEGMLDIGREKIKSKSLENQISLHLGDSEKLDFQDNNFDAVIVSFGVRNFENLNRGLNEMHRVLRRNGTVVILEFSKPTKFPFKQVYGWYFNHILPGIGSLISKDNSAYKYLPESVQEFPSGQDFLNELSAVGFKDCICKTLTFGVSSIYMARK